jgi:hypothetical protein
VRLKNSPWLSRLGNELCVLNDDGPIKYLQYKAKKQANGIMIRHRNIFFVPARKVPDEEIGPRSWCPCHDRGAQRFRVAYV